MRRRCVSTDLRRIPTLRHPRTAMNAAAMRIKFVRGANRLQKVQPSGHWTEGFLTDRTYTQPGNALAACCLKQAGVPRAS